MKNSITAKRGVIVLFILVAMMILLNLGRILKINIVDGERYREKAEGEHLSVTKLEALRGTIYDCNMNVLAQSASVWLVKINPSEIIDDNELQVVISMLSETLQIDPVKLRDKINANREYGYLEVADSVEYDMYQQLQTAMAKYTADNKEDGNSENDKYDLYKIIGFDPATIRYYPNGKLCSTILGFTGKGDIGRAGLEYYYNEEMTGTDGRIVTAKDGLQNPMPNQYIKTYDAVQGENPVLTVDSEIQTVLEEALAEALVENDAENVYGIVMDVDTGAILAMANLPDFDPNNPYELSADKVAEIEALPEEEQNAAYVKAQNELWKNKTVADRYEPGSVAKVFLVAAAMEEGVLTENSTYDCTGRIEIGDRSIKDYNPTGHGLERPVDLLINSCNTFSVHVAVDLLGIDLFYKYFEAFGFTEKTGIDLPGESASVAGVTYHDPEISFTVSDLTSSSFGQTYTITPIQIITAISCVANGGKLMKPYIVSKTVDENGKTITQNEPVVRRQVISESTAKTVLSYMERVVEEGTGTNAYIPGYRVAGKTGTSEKLETEDEVYIASFAGVAPADNPEVAILIVIDEPKGDSYSGGVIAAPVGGQVLEKILPHLGIEPIYSEGELAKMSTATPDMYGYDIDEAEKQLENSGYNVRILGKGKTVVSQSPAAGRPIMDDGIVILYTEADIAAETVEIPDFTGMSLYEANNVAVNYGLNLKVTGGSSTAGDLTAYKQSDEPGTLAEVGTVITVYFRSNNATDDGYGH